MPRDRGKRKRIATGIYQDANGYEAMVAVGSGKRRREKWKRFPRGTNLREIKDWQGEKRLAFNRTRPKGPSGTLAGDIERFLRQYRGKASAAAKRSHLLAWVREYGTLRRTAIDAEKVRLALVKWEAEGVSAKTRKHRHQSLGQLYRILDGKKAETPIDEVDAPIPGKTIPVWVDDAIIREVAYNMEQQERCGKVRSAKTRARFMVLASCGKRPAEVKRAKPTDVDLTRRIWLVRDAKGGWSEGLYLNDEMLVARTLFVEAEAWGEFDTRSFDRRLYRAGWLKGIPPYNLRHATGLTLSARGEDLADIQAWMGHKDIKTTRTFYVPVLNGRMQRMSEGMNGRLGWAAHLQSPAAPRQAWNVVQPSAHVLEDGSLLVQGHAEGVACAFRIEPHEWTPNRGANHSDRTMRQSAANGPEFARELRTVN
jgi:integrase